MMGAIKDTQTEIDAVGLSVTVARVPLSDPESEAVAVMRKRIVECLRSTGGAGVSFVDLESIQGFTAGPDGLALEVARNCFLWHGLTARAALAIRRMIADETLVLTLCSSLIYVIDGKYMALPLAKSVRDYATPRWLPVTFGLMEEMTPTDQARVIRLGVRA